MELARDVALRVTAIGSPRWRSDSSPGACSTEAARSAEWLATVWIEAALEAAPRGFGARGAPSRSDDSLASSSSSSSSWPA